jgi:hypothetical protein
MRWTLTVAALTLSGLIALGCENGIPLAGTGMRLHVEN